MTETPTRVACIPTIGLVFFVALAVFSLYGARGVLVHDDALYLYSGQQFANGIPPYQSLFDHKGPLTPIIAGLGVAVANLSGTDDITMVRITFLIISSLAVSALYLLASTLFASRRLGFLSAFTFLGFWGFGRHALSGPRAKTPMVLFEILALYLTVRKKWFSAGACGAMAALTWQPAAFIPLITVILAGAQSEGGRERIVNALRAVCGMLTPVLIISTYFLITGAFGDFFGGAVSFNLHYIERVPVSFQQQLVMSIMAIASGYAMMMIPMVLGLLMVCMLYVWRRSVHPESIRSLVARDPFAVILMSLPVPVAWSFMDFQGYADLYIVLPYLAIGFGWLLHLALNQLRQLDLSQSSLNTCSVLLCCLLIGSAAGYYRATSESGLNRQYRWAREIEGHLGPDGKLAAFSLPELLVLLRATNPNPYLFIKNGVDSWIDAHTPGGFDGWLEELEEAGPTVIALGTIRGRFKTKLMDWLHARYREIRVGDWVVFLKKD